MWLQGTTTKQLQSLRWWRVLPSLCKNRNICYVQQSQARQSHVCLYESVPCLLQLWYRQLATKLVVGGVSEVGCVWQHLSHGPMMLKLQKVP